MSSNQLISLNINNFKSLVDCQIVLQKNTFLIGINGSGKTIILQAIDFLSAIARGSVEQWLKNREWKNKDLTFSGSLKKTIEYTVEFRVDSKRFLWEFSFNRDTLKCSKEKVVALDMIDNGILLNVENRDYKVNTIKGKVNFKYKGSILSGLEENILGEDLVMIKNFLSSITSAELLSPILMKKRARKSEGDIGLGGEKLSAFVSALSDREKIQLREQLQKFFSNVFSFETKSVTAGWKNLSLTERYNGIELKTDSKHLSDGVLRIMAILSQLLKTESILLFDEIEDGVNQELVKKLVDVLIDSPHQTIVTTHSPLLLNYLPDEIAKKSIVFVYRKEDGTTKTYNFFQLITDRNKLKSNDLEYFGPGEIMQGVDLISLSDELSHL